MHRNFNLYVKEEKTVQEKKYLIIIPFYESNNMVLLVSSFPLTFSVDQLYSTSTFDPCGDCEDWINRAD